MPKEYGSQPGTPASWGPPPLTSRPEGLLASLGIQSGGQYPQHLLSDLQPTYELGPWYREFNQQFITLAITGTPYAINTATDYDTGISVPDGEVWIVNRGTITLNVAAGATTKSIIWTWGRTNNANATFLAFAPATVSPISNAGTPANLTSLVEAPPFLLRPTVKVRWRSINRTDATIDTLNSGVVTLAYTRCQIGGPTV